MNEMRILVTWGSKRGGTAGIGQIVAETLRAGGHEVIAEPARAAPAPRDVDAVIVGGALYANRWHRDARRYMERHARALRRVPVWLFSSGPLD
ncbi:MAG TPA: flavodoxin domain-containing protein, partial [Kofleriaceae bacterium]|nr:flavodoxin domain-containing protein [Kofleriaceae bacterium]